MTPTTREPSLTAAPCTLLLSSRPVRETRSVAWTTAAATAAHAAALALLLWATARMPPLAPIDGTDTIVLELPEPGLSMPRMPGPAAPAPGHADSPRRPAPAARPAPPAPHPAPPRQPPPLLGTIAPPAPPPVPRLTTPKFTFEPARAPAPPPMPAAAAKDDAVGTAPSGAVAATAPDEGAAGAGAGTGAGGAAGAGHRPTVEELELAPPTFTPFTRAPELINRAEITEYLRERYPPGLQQMGIGGQAVLWILLDEQGHVRKALLLRSSGRESLDDAALEATDHMQFSPAVNVGQNVPVWVQLPVVFRVVP